MTALSLRKLVDDALADVGVSTATFPAVRDRPRDTVWFSLGSGFGMRRYASGRSVYIVQTRMSGRLRTVTIGPSSLITHAVAASIAKRVIAHALVGDDPAEDRKRIRKAPAFDDFMTEYFSKCSPMWKASTRITHDIYRRKLIDGAFPERFIDDIGSGDIAKWFVRVTDSCGPGGANRCLDLLRMAFNKAEAWGYRIENTNPCMGQRRNRARRFERYLSPEQMAKVGAVLLADRDGPKRLQATFANAVLLLTLTGCRHSEILDLKWTDVQGKRLKLRDSKTGPRTVWLGEAARALIAAMPRTGKVEWMFWNARNGKRIRMVGAYWHDVQARAGLSGLRVHDLRHTFASHAVGRAETIPMIGRLLGHARVSSTLRYAHLDDDHALVAAQQVGDAIDKMMGDDRQPPHYTTWCDTRDQLGPEIAG